MPYTPRRFRWILAGTLAVTLLGVFGWSFFTRYHLQPWQLLTHIVQIEQAGVNEVTVQPLGWNLAILGRDFEARELDFYPGSHLPPSELDVGSLEFTVVPWKKGIEEIAANHRIVMIMEDHIVPKCREFTGETLPTFRHAGFTHLAAEAIYESSAALKRRGYPGSPTGVYTSDPRFGNLLRRAHALNFEVLGYDFGKSTHAAREEYAAEQLAKLLKNDSTVKLLVHAGHAHVFKHNQSSGDRWLAARLWEKTGVEPFTIYQWSRLHDSHDYVATARELQKRGLLADEPVLLMPPPTKGIGFRDAPYYGVEGTPLVDAIVIHPFDESTSPSNRTVLFPEQMRRVAGRWTARQWPILICAYAAGEPVDAVPLDQIMLRENESEFILWIPKEAKYEIRVLNKSGPMKAHLVHDENLLSIGTSPH